LNASPSKVVSALRTPSLVLGPFYPVSDRDVRTSSLWVGRRPRAKQHGRLLTLGGCVTNLDGQVVADALVEIWQADEQGRYRHASAPSPGPRDASFTGVGAMRTDVDGWFRFSTLKPGPYGAGANRRAPHIHFQVTGAHDRLVTQMFFPDEPLNASDRHYASTSRARQLLASVVSDTREELHLCWDIVLASG
jgi:protocatechuate 3,4-dioxygenase, beta subunit